MTGPVTPGSAGRGRRRLILALLAVVVVVLALLGIVLLAAGDDSRPVTDMTSTSPATSVPSTTSSAAASGSAGAAPTSTAAAPTATSTLLDPNVAPPTLPPVALAEPAETDNGVMAQVTSVEAFTSDASGPGNLAGPALRITVRLTNGTGADLGLDAVSVNLSYGADATPASPLEDSSQRTFAGSLVPGGSAEGIYAFSVPRGQRDLIAVEVGYAAGAPVLAFSGPAD